MRFIFCFYLVYASAAWGSDRSPSPELTPENVVEIVAKAMANNDSPRPDSGIERAFQFASPSNRKVTGPFWHFKTMIQQPDSAPLINHTSRVIGQPDFFGDTVSIPLIIFSANGEVAGFLWSLSKQTAGAYIDSWMTDSVVRVPIGSKLKAL